MSGIAGVWNLDGRPVEPELLERISARLAHRGGDGEGLWREGAAGLACQLFRVTPESRAETQPLADGSGAVAVFDGRLDNREELLWRLPAAAGLTPDSPDPAVVLAAYHAYGEDLPAELAGDFALAIYDSAQRKLLLARDALGVRPLYYHRAGRILLFASEIKAILAHPAVQPRPAEIDLADFLLADSPLRSDTITFFEGVHSLRPSHVLVVTPDAERLRQYWDFDTTHKTRFARFEEYGEAFRAYFETAVRRRMRSAHPVGFSVSGGLDSSSIFCVAQQERRRAPHQYPNLPAFTFDSPEGSPSDEMAYIRAIEQECGVAVERVPVGRGMLEGRAERLGSLERLAYHVEGPFLDEQWATTHRILDTMRRRGVRVVLTGHWGDQVLFTQAYLMDLLHSFKMGMIRAHMREYRRWLTDTDPKCFTRRFLLDLVKYHVPESALPLLRRMRARFTGPIRDYPWYSDRLRKLAQRSSYRSMRPAGGFVTTHTQALYEEARARYHVLSLEWDSKVASMHGLEMAFPFLDRDLLSFLMSIPGEVQTRDGVPKAILREALRGVLPQAIAQRSWKADFFHLISAGMEEDYPHLAGLLERNGDAVRWGYVDEAEMRKSLGALRGVLNERGGANLSRLVSLLGLNLWLRVFFSGSLPRQTSFAQRESTLASTALGGIE